MAFRAPTVKKQPPRLGFKLLKIFIAIALLIVAAVIGAVLYFNGQNIKAPLLKFLSDRTSFSINCQQIEFSALYPNILKLKGVDLDKTHIDEIYVEYDLQSIIKSDTLKLKYFYAKGIATNDANLKSLKSEKFGFKDILIEKLDLLECPISLEGFSSLKANISASKAYIDSNGAFSFDSAKLNFESGLIDNTKIKKFSGNITNNSKELTFEDLSFQIFGGTVNGSLGFDKESKEITARNISLRNLIFKEDNGLSEKYSIKAGTISVNNCLLALPTQDLMLGDITGKLDNLNIGEGRINYSFTGRVGEISKPGLQLTADESRIRVLKTDEVTDIKVKGNLFNAAFGLDASIHKADGHSSLVIHDLKIKGGKIEATEDLVDYLMQSSFKYSLTLENLCIENTEIVSFIDKYPLSVQSVNTTCSNLKFDSQLQRLTSSNGEILFSFDNAYYSDLFIRGFYSKTIIDDKKIITEVPKIQFQKSIAAIKVQFNYPEASKDDLQLEMLSVNSDGFELSELNSNLINHLLNGKIIFNCQLQRTEDNTPDSNENNSLPRHIKVLTQPNSTVKTKLVGKAQLSGKSLLISDLGLDLVNGGKNKSYLLTKNQFLESVRGTDAGLFDLNIIFKIDDNTIIVKGNTDLTSSHATLNGKVDLHDQEMLLKTTFVSLNKDCITRLVIRGDINNPKILITPVTRGAIRPGINDDILETKDKEEISTDIGSKDSDKGGIEKEPQSEAPESITVSEIL